MRWTIVLVVVALLLFLVPAAAVAVDDFESLCDPAQRGPEAVKIARLRECPAAATWGYDLPYTYAYGSGVPYYTGHNFGMPSGAIYENPGAYPYGIPEPGVINGNLENAMLVNYGYSFPFHEPTYFLRSGPLYGDMFSPFAFTG